MTSHSFASCVFVSIANLCWEGKSSGCQICFFSSSKQSYGLDMGWVILKVFHFTMSIWNLRLCHRQSRTNFQGLENWWWEYSVAVDGPNLRYLFNSFFLFFGVIPSCAGFCPSTAMSGQHEDSYIFLSRRARLSIFLRKRMLIPWTSGTWPLVLLLHIARLLWDARSFWFLMFLYVFVMNSSEYVNGILLPVE